MLMKKLLLMLVAVMATMTAFANAEDEGWTKSFTPVADKSDLAGVHTAVASDGSVYVSSTYDQAFTFAEKSITDPEGLLSSCIVKYDAEGNEKWAVSLVGACTINAMTVDADGTLYATGEYTDAVTLSGTSGSKDLSGDFSKTSAFVAKVNADGVFTDVASFTPTANLPEGYEDWCELGIYPNKIVIDANKVLVSCMFKGDVADLEWQGSYVDVYGMAYMDNRSAGVFMLDKADLSNPTSVATIQHTGRIVDQMMEDIQDFPNAIDFVVYGGIPHIAFVGWGNLTLTTPAGSQPFSFEMAGDGNNEHALVLVNAVAPSQPKIFHASTNSYGGATYNLVNATLAGTNCILAGTFYGNFPLDNTVTKEKNTSFVASIKMSDCSVNWAKANEVASEAKCMIVAGEEIHAAANEIQKETVEEKEVEVKIGKHYVFKTADGTLKKTEEQGFEDADCYNDEFVSTVAANENSVVVFCPKMNPSGINEAQAQKNGAVKYYNVNGVELSAPQKGLNIVKTADGVKKVTVK